jgi:hypothetical protein
VVSIEIVAAHGDARENDSTPSVSVIGSPFLSYAYMKKHTTVLVNTLCPSHGGAELFTHVIGGTGAIPRPND